MPPDGWFLNSLKSTMGPSSELPCGPRVRAVARRARWIAQSQCHGPIDAGPETILHVRFTGSAPSDRVVGAMEAFKAVLRDRPGATRVIIHVPVPGGGAALPMELRRRVAYDAELLAEVRRRLPDGSIELRLA